MASASDIIQFSSANDSTKAPQRESSSRTPPYRYRTPIDRHPTFTIRGEVRSGCGARVPCKTIGGIPMGEHSALPRVSTIGRTEPKNVHPHVRNSCFGSRVKRTNHGGSRRNKISVRSAAYRRQLDGSDIHFAFIRNRCRFSLA